MEELEDDLRAPASSILGRSERVGLVVAARRRLRIAPVRSRDIRHGKPLAPCRIDQAGVK